MIKGVRKTNVYEINRLWKENDEFHRLFPDLYAYKDIFREYMQMSKEMFYYLESRMEHYLDKPSINFIRTSVTAAKKLLVTLP